MILKHLDETLLEACSEDFGQRPPAIRGKQEPVAMESDRFSNEAVYRLVN